MSSRFKDIPELVMPEQIDDGIWRAAASEQGPVVSVMGGIHGEERAGQEVVAKMASQGVPMVRGVLYLMHGNLEAMRLGVHQIGDENMNRMFVSDTTEDGSELSESVAAKRVQTLRSYLDESGALLDLHEAHSGRIEEFIICEPNAFATAQSIGAGVISFGWSTTEPGGTDGYMYESGKRGLCYELGYIDDFAKNVVLGEAAVERFLSAEGLDDRAFEPLFQDRSTRFIRALKAFRRDLDGDNQIAFADNYVTFDRLPKDKPVAWHGARPVILDTDDLVALFPNRGAQPGQEFLSLGQEVSGTEAHRLATTQ